MSRSLRTLGDLGTRGVVALLDRARDYALLRGTSAHPRPLEGRPVALLFDKPSTRTRLSLEIAVRELGGFPVVLEPGSSQMGRGEPLEDTARVLGRMVSAVAFRTGDPRRLETLSEASGLPVLNALTDDAHPLQVLADLHAVREARGSLEALRVGWVGDASNVARSWIEAAGLLRLELVLACPEGYGPPAAEVDAARARGGNVRVSSDAREAAQDADILVTDVWVSMGQEAEADARRAALGPFQLSEALLAAARPGARVLHCLPAHRGEEIEAAVIDGERSLVWEAVEARLHTTKAALEWAVGALLPDGAG